MLRSIETPGVPKMRSGKNESSGSKKNVGFQLLAESRYSTMIDLDSQRKIGHNYDKTSFRNILPNTYSGVQKRHENGSGLPGKLPSWTSRLEKLKSATPALVACASIWTREIEVRAHEIYSWELFPPSKVQCFDCLLC